MLESFRQNIASVFEVPEHEPHLSVKLGRIFMWFAVTGITGGISPFIRLTNHGLLISSLASVIFIILTAKPFSKWLVKIQTSRTK